MTEGNPTIWLEKFLDVNDRIVNAIGKVWPDCCSVLEESPSEDKVTDTLALKLQHHPDVRGSWLLVPQYKLLAASFKGDVVTKGKIDFVVFIDKNQDNYIAYECKRLNVTFPSGFQTLSDKYISQGLMRYVSAQYAQDLPCGVMIGYVFDGDIPAAVTSIKKNVKSATTKLCCLGTPPTTDLPKISIVTRFLTKHLRSGGEIEVHHLLLAMPILAAA